MSVSGIGGSRGSKAAGPKVQKAEKAFKGLKNTPPPGNRVRDGFDAEQGRRREDLAKAGFGTVTDPAEIASKLEGDRKFAKLYQDPATKNQLDALKIRDGADLRAFGQRMERLAAEGGPERATDNPLPSDDPAALARVTKATVETPSGRGTDTLSGGAPQLGAYQARADIPPLSSAEQAHADAAQVQAAHDEVKAQGQSDAQAARAAAAELERLAQAHEGDAAYVNNLVREAAPTIDKIATTLGANTEGAFKDGDDKDAIKASIRSMAKVAEAGGAVTAGALGRTLASKVDDDSELNHFDDAFYDYKDEGGTNLLFDATVSALSASGKGSAAGELAERGGDGGLVDGVKDGVGNVVGSIGDAFGAVAGFATDLGEGVLHVVSEAGEFAVDVTQNTVDLVGDAASWTADQVGNAAQYAIEQGLKLAGPVLDKVRDLAREGIDKGLGISENIDSLQPGDKLSVGGSFEAQLGVQIEASADLQVAMDTGPDGRPIYTVSGEVEAGVGIGVGGSGTAGVGGKMEFTFDNPEDAAKAAKILAAGAAGVVALGSPAAVLAPALLPSPDDLSFLHRNLKSVEVSGSVGAEFEAAAGVEGEVEGEAAFRLDFEDGKPVSMTRETEVAVQGSAGGPLEMFEGSGLTIPAGATAQGKVTVQTTIPIDGSGVTDIAGFIASPATAAISGEAETSITLEGDFTVGGNAGVHGEIKIDDIDSSEVRSVVGKLLGGDYRHALDGVEVQVTGSASAFHDDGFEFAFDGTIAGQGIEVNAHNEVRREDRQEEFEVRLG
ncbi:MAG: hypothetical protein ACYC8T_02250 [Myxococcaceae bacterium]